MKSIWRINTICGFFKTVGRGLTRREFSYDFVFRRGFTRRGSLCRYSA
jgi:hypothetical protein